MAARDRSDVVTLQVPNAEAGRMLVLAGRTCLVMAGVAPVASLVALGHAGVAEIVLRVAAGLVAAVVLGAIGTLAVSYGRRLQVPSGEPLVSGTNRIVLFLRSFSADSTTMPGTEDIAATLRTAEETLRDRLADVGEMVAIGRPGEVLPPIGAPRIYRGDDEWRGTVLDLMRRSRLTVLTYGSSPGLLWEIQSALAHVPAERLVLWFPTRELWHAFEDFTRTGGYWSRGLPSTRADVRLLAFYPDGLPRVLEVHGTTVVHDFSSEYHPDATEPGDVSPGGLEAYLRALP